MTRGDIIPVRIGGQWFVQSLMTAEEARTVAHAIGLHDRAAQVLMAEADIVDANNGEADEPVTEPDVEWVVTRYGGHRHAPMFLDTNSNQRNRRYTLCRGVSAWTLASWASVPDHPTLTVEQIEALPFCPACLASLPKAR